MAIYQQMVSELHKARSLPLSRLYTPGSSACLADIQISAEYMLRKVKEKMTV